MRPEYPGHVWAYDLVEGRTHEGRKFPILTIIDEASRASLCSAGAHRGMAAQTGRRAGGFGRPVHHTGATCKYPIGQWRPICRQCRAAMARQIGVRTLYIAPRSPWDNGYHESFNGSLRDELLDGEIFYSLAESKVLIEAWRRHYNTVRPHSSLCYRPPAPGTTSPPYPASGSASLHFQPDMAAATIIH